MHLRCRSAEIPYYPNLVFIQEQRDLYCQRIFPLGYGTPTPWLILVCSTATALALDWQVQSLGKRCLAQAFALGTGPDNFPHCLNMYVVAQNLVIWPHLGLERPVEQSTFFSRSFALVTFMNRSRKSSFHNLVWDKLTFFFYFYWALWIIVEHWLWSIREKKRGH